MWRGDHIYSYESRHRESYGVSLNSSDDYCETIIIITFLVLLFLFATIDHWLISTFIIALIFNGQKDNDNN